MFSNPRSAMMAQALDLMTKKNIANYVTIEILNTYVVGVEKYFSDKISFLII